MSDQISYSLGVITQGKQFKSVEEISADLHGRLSKASGSVQRLLFDFAWSHLTRDYVRFRELLAYHELMHGLKLSFERSPEKHWDASLFSAVVNWLTAVHLFLDHAEAELSRDHGPNSPQLERLNAAMSAQYDTLFGYRFCYKLRNFVLHCGLPPFRTTLTTPDAESPPWAEQKFRLLLDREELLDRFKKWSTVGHDLRTQNREFEFAPLVDEAMDGLAKVHAVLVRERIERSMSFIDELLAAGDRISQASPEGHPVVFSIAPRPTEEGLNVSWTHLRTDVAAQLRNAVQSVDDIEALIKAERPPDLSDDWAANLKEGALSSRFAGVRVLLKWFEEGRFSPAFVQFVRNELSATDGHDAVINGLVTAAAVLAHMSAATVGTEAHLLVARLGSVDPAESSDGGETEPLSSES